MGGHGETNETDRPRHWRDIARAIGRALLIAIPVGVAVYAGFLALAWVSLGADRAALVGAAREGFAQRQLQVEQGYRFGDTDLGIHQYNDCLILYQAIDDRAPAAQRAVSPLSPVLERGFPCLQLRTLVTTGPDRPPHFYHRYLHAHTTIARLLLPSLGVRGTRELYRLLISVVLLASIAYAGIDVARGRRGDLAAVWLILSLVFARLYGLEGFGQSLGHAPADLILIGFLLFLNRASAAGPLSRPVAWTAAALFGALTIQFEFLTGGLPLGFALVLGGMTLALRPDPALPATVAGAAAAYLAGALVCAAAKLVALWVTFGPAPLADIMAQLMVRTGVGTPPATDGATGLGDFLGNWWIGADALAPGMRWLTVGLLGLALIGGGWGYRRLSRSPDETDRMRATALLGSNLAILLWLAVFWQHSVTHALFMARLLVWPIATGSALFVLAIRQQGETAPVAR